MDKYFNFVLTNLSIYQKILYVSIWGLFAKEESNGVNAAVCAFEKQNKKKGIQMLFSNSKHYRENS